SANGQRSTANLSGKLDLKTSPPRIVVMHGDAAVVIVHDAMHDGQAEAGAAALGRKIWEKELVLVGVGNAASGIGHFDDHAMRRAARGDADLAALGGLDRILEQVAHGAADLLRIDEQLDAR